MTEEVDQTNKKKSEKIYSIIIVILIFIGLGYVYMQSRKTKFANPNTSPSSIIPNDENFLAGRTDLVPIVHNIQNPTRLSTTRQNPTRMSTSRTPGKYINASPYWPNWSKRQNQTKFSKNIL